MSNPDQGRGKDLRTYLVGYASALALTAGAFAAVRWRALGSAHTAALVVGLALVQVIVQFRCFLHISLRRSTRDDLRLIVFTALIITLMVSGTIVVLDDLDARMR